MGVLEGGRGVGGGCWREREAWVGGVGGREDCGGRESEVWVRVLEGERGERSHW